MGKLRGIRLQKYTSLEFSWGLTSWILLLREPSLAWFQLMAIFVKFGTKANKLSVVLVEPRVIKLMNAPTRISVIVVVKRVSLSVIVLIPGVLGSLMFKILLKRALPIASAPVLGLTEMLIMITLLRAPRSLSLIQGLFLLLLMDWVLGMPIKIFLPRVSQLLSWIQGFVRLVMLIKTFLPRVPRSLSLN